MQQVCDFIKPQKDFSRISEYLKQFIRCKIDFYTIKVFYLNKNLNSQDFLPMYSCLGYY